MAAGGGDATAAGGGEAMGAAGGGDAVPYVATAVTRTSDALMLSTPAMADAKSRPAVAKPAAVMPSMATVVVTWYVGLAVAAMACTLAPPSIATSSTATKPVRACCAACAWKAGTAPWRQ